MTRLKRLADRRAAAPRPALEPPDSPTAIAPGLGYSTWTSDPVAQQYLAVEPSAREPLHHASFTAALLYRGANGGAIILQTHDRRVLALDYSDPEELEYQWRETLLFYANVI